MSKQPITIPIPPGGGSGFLNPIFSSWAEREIGESDSKHEGKGALTIDKALLNLGRVVSDIEHRSLRPIGGNDWVGAANAMLSFKS